MNNKTVDSVRSALRHLALGTVVGAMMIGGVACGGSPESTPTASSTTSTTTTTSSPADTGSPAPSDTGSPSSSTGTQGASETVTVTETGAESTTTPGSAASPPPGGKPLARPVQQQITRDPFVNPLTGGGATMASTRTARSTTPRVTTPGGNTAAKTPGGTSGPKGAEVPEEEINPPDVTVTGIVIGSTGSMAIISSPDRSSIARVGDTLAEYKILAISPGAVTFGLKGHKFKVKLQEEFGPGATGTKTKK